MQQVAMPFFHCVPVNIVLSDCPEPTAEMICCNQNCSGKFQLRDGSFWSHFNGRRRSVYGTFCGHKCSLETMPAEYLNQA